MKHFRQQVDKVATQLPLGLVQYMKTCTNALEVKEVLEIELDRKYQQPLDWLYSVLSKSTIKETEVKFNIPTITIEGKEYLLIEDGGLLDPNTLAYLRRFESKDGNAFYLWKDRSSGEYIATPSRNKK